MITIAKIIEIERSVAFLFELRLSCWTRMTSYLKINSIPTAHFITHRLLETHYAYSQMHLSQGTESRITHLRASRSSCIGGESLFLQRALREGGAGEKLGQIITPKAKLYSGVESVHANAPWCSAHPFVILIIPPATRCIICGAIRPAWWAIHHTRSSTQKMPFLSLSFRFVWLRRDNRSNYYWPQRISATLVCVCFPGDRVCGVETFKGWEISIVLFVGECFEFWGCCVVWN